MDGKYNDDELFFYGAEGSRTLDLWSAIPALSQTELQPRCCQTTTYKDRQICQTLFVSNLCQFLKILAEIMTFLSSRTDKLDLHKAQLPYESVCLDR